MARASLAMYDFLPELQAANDRVWQAVRDRLAAGGFDPPDSLDRAISYDGIWLQPDLVLAQACGYPYVRDLKGRVRLVATPVYSFPGGEGTERASFIVVPKSSEARSLEDLRGRVAAINDRGSNSGMNLLRAAVAPLAKAGRFFSDVTITGGHIASIAALSAGKADVAAIDTVTWGMAARHRPDMLDSVRILGQTPTGPGLPYITRLSASDAEVDALRGAIASAITDPACADAIDALGLRRIEILTDDDYDRLDAHRRDAERLGYPIIA
jgi:ABC-type phosphate/phosphonate transport system substrate-binding protein